MQPFLLLLHSQLVGTHAQALLPLLLQGQLAETHVEIGKQLQAEGSLKEAERHFVEGGDWKAAVQMYRAAGMWEGSLRLAKAHGGALATKQVALSLLSVELAELHVLAQPALMIKADLKLRYGHTKDG